MTSFENFRDCEEGCSGLVWSQAVSKWICGGSVGSGHVFDSQQGDQFERIELGSDESAVTAVAVHDGLRLFAHSVTDSVALRSVEDLDNVLDEKLVRCSLPITHLEFTFDGKFLVIASGDPDLLFYSLDKKQIVDKITTNSVGIRTFALSKANSHLAILDLNGTVTIYNLQQSGSAIINEGSPFVSKELVSTHSRIASTELIRDDKVYGCKMCWYEKGGEMALLVPSGDTVTILSPNPGKWAENFLFTPALPGKVHVLSLDSAQEILLGGHVSGGVTLWHLGGSEGGEVGGRLSLSKEFKHISSVINTPLIDLSVVNTTLLLITGEKWGRVEGVGLPLPAPAPAPAPASASVYEVESVPVSAADAELFEVISEEISDEHLMLAMANYEREQEETPLGDTQAEPSAFLSSQALPAEAPRKRLHKTTALSTLAPMPPMAKEGSGSAPTAGTKEGDDDSMLLEEQETTKKASSKPAKAMFHDEAESDGGDYSEDEGGEEEAPLGEEDELPPAALSSVDLAQLQASLSKGPKLQLPFQPASTTPDEKSRRYLVWNHVGAITIREESLENRVEIRFTNANQGKTEAFPDRSGFIMGALSYEGAVFATEGEEAGEEDPYSLTAKVSKGSTIYYHAFTGKFHLLGANESFRWTLPPGEVAKGVAVGKGWVAVASSKHYLRLFSSTGQEIGVYWMKGPLLCMTGCEGKLAVFYHASTTYHQAEAASTNHAGIFLDMFELDWQCGCKGKVVVQHFPVPVSSKATLDWAGFDIDLGALSVLDSQGVLSTLVQGMGWQWAPVLNVQDVRKSIDHKYWPITIRGDKLVYVLLNGENKPAVFPVPVASNKSLRVILSVNRDGKEMNEAMKEKHHILLWEEVKTTHLESIVSESTLKGQYSEELTRLEQSLEKQQEEVDKTVLKLFQEACQTQQVAVALSLGLRLRATKSLQAGIVIANHFGRRNVASALDQMLQYKQSLEQMQQEAGGYGVVEEEAGVAGGAGGGIAYQGDYTEEYDEGYDQAEYQTGGVLSKKVSLKQQPPLKSSKAVTPEGGENSLNKKEVGLNPFAVNKNAGTTPVKRKIEDDLKVLSPSPKLKRSSTFAQAALTHRLQDRRMI